jgi:hypothetical protein
MAILGWLNDDYTFIPSLVFLTEIHVGYHPVTSELLSLPNLRIMSTGFLETEFPPWITCLTLMKALQKKAWNLRKLGKISELQKLTIRSKVMNPEEIILAGKKLRKLKVIRESRIREKHVKIFPELEIFKLLTPRNHKYDGYNKWLNKVLEEQ